MKQPIWSDWLRVISEQPIWDLFLKLPRQIQLGIVISLLAGATVRSPGNSQSAQMIQSVSSQKAIQPIDKPKWVNPAPGAVLTDWQRIRTSSPVDGSNTNYCHNGFDLAGPVGLAIKAVAEGIVVFAGWSPTNHGLMVLLQHKDDTYTGYAHNSKLLVEKGEKVKAGQSIAEMGSTGYSSGPHLHFFHIDRQGNSYPVNHWIETWNVKIDSPHPRPAKECSRYTPTIAQLISNITQ